MTLGVMKLGAVALPATTQPSPNDVHDRVELGGVICVVVDTTELHRFNSMNADVEYIAVGAQRDDWADLVVTYDTPARFAPDGLTRATDPLLLHLTLDTMPRPKLAKHIHQNYPIGRLSTMYWIDLQSSDIHWDISSPDWARHAWSCFFIPWGT